MDGQSRMGGSYLKIVTGINLENTAGEYKRWSEIGRKKKRRRRRELERVKARAKATAVAHI